MKILLIVSIVAMFTGFYADSIAHWTRFPLFIVSIAGGFSCYAHWLTEVKK